MGKALFIVHLKKRTLHFVISYSKIPIQVSHGRTFSRQLLCHSCVTPVSLLCLAFNKPTNRSCFPLHLPSPLSPSLCLLALPHRRSSMCLEGGCITSALRFLRAASSPVTPVALRLLPRYRNWHGHRHRRPKEIGERTHHEGNSFSSTGFCRIKQLGRGQT